MRLLIFGYAITVGACSAGPSAADITRTYEHEVAVAIASTESKLVWPRCTVPAKPGRCGLLADVWARPDKAAVLVESLCPPAPEGQRVTDECLRIARAAFASEMPIRYPLAKPWEIDQLCRAQPDECAGNARLEIQWLKSHDAAAIAAGMADHERARIRRNQSEAEENVRVLPHVSNQRVVTEERKRRAFDSLQMKVSAAAAEALSVGAVSSH